MATKKTTKKETAPKADEVEETTPKADEVEETAPKAGKPKQAIMIRDFASPQYNLKVGDIAPASLAQTLVVAKAAQWLEKTKAGGKVEDRKLPK